MQKIIVVGLREFRVRIRNRGFLISAFAAPLILIFVWAFTGNVGAPSTGSPLANLTPPPAGQAAPLGYVDEAGIIENIPAPLSPSQFRAYPDQSSANAALKDGQISAYYVVPADYVQTGEVDRVSNTFPSAPPDNESFNWVLVSNLFPGASTRQMALYRWPLGTSGPQFVSVTPEGETGGTSNTWLPFLVAVAVMLPLVTSGGYLLQSLAQEKGSRVMEILLVSMRPPQLLAGKLLGLGALSLVQYAFWVVIAGLALAVTGSDVGQFLSGIRLSATEAALVVPFALGGFLLYAALMAGIGALAPNLEGTRAWVFVVSLPMLIPLYLWVSIVQAPNGSLATLLSLIPFSAPLAMLMRMTATGVPGWQLALSLGLLVATAFGLILLMARLFRVQTLLSGEALSLRRFLSALRTG